MRGEGGVAAEGRLVGACTKVHSWGKCTMPLMNINSVWMSNALWPAYYILLFILRRSFKLHLGV